MVPFELLFERHKDRIYRLCKIMVNDPQNLDDLFQEVSVNIWKGLAKFRGNSKVETWIYRIIVNTSITFNSKQKNYQDKKQKYNENLSTQTQDDPQNEILLKAILQLDSSDKATIGLYLEGYAYKEIADILGITTSNVGVRIKRIKDKIKLLLNTKSKTYEL